MEKICISDVTIFDIAQAKAAADNQLQETPAEKFEKNLNQILNQEIENGLLAAKSFKHMVQGATTFTYIHTFPLAIYNTLTEDTLCKLELSDIYLTKNKELGTANIRIVFHFV